MEGEGLEPQRGTPPLRAVLSGFWVAYGCASGACSIYGHECDHECGHQYDNRFFSTSQLKKGRYRSPSLKILTYPYSLKSAGWANHPQNQSMSFRLEDHVGILTHNSCGVLYISHRGQLRSPLHGSYTNPNFSEDIPLDGPYQHPNLWEDSLSENHD